MGEIVQFPTEPLRCSNCGGSALFVYWELWTTECAHCQTADTLPAEEEGEAVESEQDFSLRPDEELDFS